MQRRLGAAEAFAKGDARVAPSPEGGERARLDTQCIWRSMNAEGLVIDHIEGGSDVFFVVFGHVRVIVKALSGRDVILWDIRDGEYFGELAAIDGRPRSAGIRAVTDTVVAQMPASAFWAAIYQRPSVCQGLLSQLASEVRGLARRLRERDVLSGRERLVTELLRLSRRTRKHGDGFASAHSCRAWKQNGGAVAKVITRELKPLETQGLIEKRRGALVLLNIARFEQLLNEAE